MFFVIARLSRKDTGNWKNAGSITLCTFYHKPFAEDCQNHFLREGHYLAEHMREALKNYWGCDIGVTYVVEEHE